MPEGLPPGGAMRPPSHAPSWTRIAWEPLLAALLAALLYRALYAELPYHDAARFAEQVASGHPVWDVAHVLMQPATLLWHRLLGAGEAPEVSQKHVSTLAAAIAAGLFHALLCRLRVPVAGRVAATALLAGSASVMILAPSAHMKLLAMPILTAALGLGTLWERERRGEGVLAAGAVLLGLAGAFLVSCMAALPFVAAAVLAAGLRRGEGARAWLRATGYAALAGGVFALLLLGTFAAFGGQPLTPAGLLAAVADKEALRPGAFGPTDAVARLVYGTANNLVAAPLLGSVLRGWLAGYVASLRPFAGRLALQALPWLATLALVGLAYAAGLLRALRGRPVLLPIGFLLGAQAWAGWYSLNDPEHWFALSAPTLLLFLLCVPRGAMLVVPWAAAVLAINLALIGLPQACYPLLRHRAALLAAFTPGDLLVDFAAYPGHAYLGSFTLPGLRVLSIDAELEQDGGPQRALDGVARQVDATLAAGGRVVVFGVLDPDDWDAPWAVLTARGLGKPRLVGFLHGRYAVRALPAIAEMPAWELRAGG